jgi:hypothetical protein
MRMRIATLSLLTVCCLMLAAAPAMAGTTLPTIYDNGPINGTTDAWTINFGFSVSDSFRVASGSVIDRMNFNYWDADPNDLLNTVDVAIGSTSFGGTAVTASVGLNVVLGTNQFGYTLVTAFTDIFPDVPWSGDGFVTLSNACTLVTGCSVSNPIYWDENSGAGCLADGCPSTAYENTIGSIPSESFSLVGAATTTTTTGTTPEPSSIMLFGSGVLGLASLLRRRLHR